jgi:hypothetical protein
MRTEVKSSLLKSVAYNRATRELEVEFKPKAGEQEGKVYRYADVDIITYEKFINAPSIGRAFLNEIKPAHSCTRVKEEKEDATSQESVPKAPDGDEIPF